MGTLVVFHSGFHAIIKSAIDLRELDFESGIGNFVYLRRKHFWVYQSSLRNRGPVLMLIFAGISAWIAGRHVFVLHRVDFNSLVGAFCVYLLLGFIWAILFCLLQLLGLATFSGLIATDEPFPQLIYFSFVTLVSLGYGDITPDSELARVLSYFEALTGQFYLAVLVASLVGAFSNQYRSNR